MIYVIKRFGHGTTNTETIAISLAPAPFTVPTADHDETAPRSMPIRGEMDWRKDAVLRQARGLR